MSRDIRMLMSAIVTTLALSACATITTTSDFDRDIDFTPYKRFSWQASNAALVQEDAVSLNPFSEKRITAAIVNALLEKGYHHVHEEAQADFILSFEATEERKTELVPLLVPSVHYFPTYGFNHRGRHAHHHDHFGYSLSFYGYGSGTRSYTESALKINMIDGKTKSPIWIGVARRRVSTDQPRNTTEHVVQIVSSILAEFPPLAR